MTLAAKMPLAFALLLWAALAGAQSNVGELLDAGAKRLSPEEFKQELVQRVIVGPTLTKWSLEIMYTAVGQVQGTGSGSDSSDIPHFGLVPIQGDWTIDDNGRVCTSMRIGAGPAMGSVHGVLLPKRCQVWFKLGDKYFLSDSDSDRRTRVLVRTLKQ